MMLPRGVIAIALLVAAGLYPAMRLAGRRAAPVLAPMVTVAAAGVGALVSLVVPAPPFVVVVGVLVLLHVMATVRPARRGTTSPGRGLRVRSVDAFTVLVCVAPPVAGTLTAATAFDARVTWFLHARWMMGSQHRLLSAIASRGFAAHNPDYPPGVAATIAGIWRVVRSTDPEIAQLVCAVLTGLALGFAALSITDVRAERAIDSAVRWEPWLLPVVLSGGAFAIVREFGFNGYMDGFLASTAACLAITTFRAGASAFAVGVLSCTAALTKNEGLVLVACMALGISVVPHLRRQVGRARVIAVWTGVVAGGAWIVAVRGRGASSWYTAASVTESLRAGDGFARRAAIASGSIAKQLAGVTVLFVVCLLLARASRSNAERAVVWARRGSPQWVGLWIAVVAIGIAGVTISYFVASAQPIRPLLGGSVERVTMTPKLLLVVAGLLLAPPFPLLIRARRHAVAGLLLAIVLVGQGARIARLYLNPAALHRSSAFGRQLRCIERQLDHALPRGTRVVADGPILVQLRLEALTYPRYELLSADPPRPVRDTYLLQVGELTVPCPSVHIERIARTVGTRPRLVVGPSVPHERSGSPAHG